MISASGAPSSAVVMVSVAFRPSKYVEHCVSSAASWKMRGAGPQNAPDFQACASFLLSATKSCYCHVFESAMLYFIQCAPT